MGDGLSLFIENLFQNTREKFIQSKNHKDINTFTENKFAHETRIRRRFRRQKTAETVRESPAWNKYEKEDNEKPRCACEG